MTYGVLFGVILIIATTYHLKGLGSNSICKKTVGLRPVDKSGQVTKLLVDRQNFQKNRDGRVLF
jgi:hypothetical protein